MRRKSERPSSYDFFGNSSIVPLVSLILLIFVLLNAATTSEAGYSSTVSNMNNTIKSGPYLVNTWNNSSVTFNTTTTGTAQLSTMGNANFVPYCIDATFSNGKNIASWSDNFTTYNTSRWNTDSPGTVSIVSSKLNVVATTSWFDVRSVNARPLLDSYYQATIVRAPNNSGYALFNVTYDNSNYFSFERTPTTLKFFSVIGNNKVYGATTVNWAAASPVLVRLKAIGTQVTWQYSSDGTTWTTGHTFTTGYNLASDATARFVTGYSAAAPTQSAQYDDFSYYSADQNKLYASSTGTLAPYITITIEQGTGGGNGSCTGFTSESTLYSGVMSAMPSTYATGVGGWSPANSPDAKVYKFTATTNNPTAATGKTSTTTFSWASQPQ